MVVKVEVTQEDIDAAKPQDMKNCPLAKAVSRAYGKKVEISSIHAWVGVFTSARLPQIAIDFFSAFDNGRKVKPISFKLDFVTMFGAT